MAILELKEHTNGHLELRSTQMFILEFGSTLMAILELREYTNAHSGIKGIH